MHAATLLVLVGLTTSQVLNDTAVNAKYAFPPLPEQCGPAHLEVRARKDYAIAVKAGDTPLITQRQRDIARQAVERMSGSSLEVRLLWEEIIVLRMKMALLENK